MTRREVHVELLLGKRVVDTTGSGVGRIEEIIVERHGDDYLVREFHVGNYAFLERFGSSSFLRALIRRLDVKGSHTIYRIPWEALDLKDPDHPRLDRVRNELERVPS